MTEQNEIKTGPITIDEPTAREKMMMMGYYKIENHDKFVKYIKSLEENIMIGIVSLH
jgi:hypothetical protein